MKRMEVRIVSPEGRVVIPPEYLDAFGIKPKDKVEVTLAPTHIKIQKHREQNVCVVTGKLSHNGRMFGEAFVSNEGLKLIKEQLNSFESE